MKSGYEKTPIDIAMTAVLRPALLNGTLKTIIKYVVDDVNRFRLILNIDSVGENVHPSKVIEVAKKHFPNIVYNIAREPSFPKAVKWVWSQTTAPYVFHWEDDVDILRKININKMIQILESNPKMSSLRLYKGRTPPNKKWMTTFLCRWVYNDDGFYLAKDWKKQFGLNPILIKKQFIDEAIVCMRDDINPEKQFRSSQAFMNSVIKKWEYAIFANPGESRIIDGRKGQAWKDKMGFQKPKGETFLKWKEQL